VASAVWSQIAGDRSAVDFAYTSAALQNAIDRGSGFILIGPGVYDIDDTAVLRSDLHIVGCGASTILRRNGGFLGVHVFDDGGSALSNVVLSDLTFDNNSLATSTHDLAFTGGSSRITIERCRWINLLNRAGSLVQFATTTGAHHRHIRIRHNDVIGGTTTSTLNSFQVFCASDVDVSYNEIDGWGAIKVEQSSTSTAVMRRIKVHGNTFYNVDQSHIFVRPAGATEIEDVSVVGNVGSVSAMTVLKGMIVIGELSTGSGGITRNVAVSANSGRGHQGHFISIAGVNGTVENFAVTGNTFDGRYDGASSIEATSESSGINFTTTSKRGTITGNTIRYTGRSGIRGAGDHVVVSGNVCEFTAQNDLAAPTPVREAGIYIFNTTTNVTVANNIVYNSGTATTNGSYVTGGIVIDNQSSIAGVLVQGNTVYDDRTGVEGMEYGIKVGISGGGANPDEVIVTQNRLIGASAGPIILYGTGTHIVEDNVGSVDAGYKGVDVASAATVTLPVVGRYFDVTGTTSITSVTASWPGRVVTLQFDGALTFTDGSNLRLNGNYVTTTDDTITLISDGTNWHETSRSAN
jgi:hypothetical protein